VVTVCARLLAELTSETVAPAMAEPFASFTVPVIEPALCAKALLANPAISKILVAQNDRNLTSLCSCFILSPFLSSQAQRLMRMRFHSETRATSEARLFGRLSN